MASNAFPGTNGLRVAALSDVHGNIRALDAVLEEVEWEGPDRIVFCGDAASGPFPGETLSRMMELGDNVRFIRGNGDREIVSAFDQQLPFNPEEKNPARLFSSWCAQRIDREQRDFLARFEDRVVLEVAVLGRTCFCHGSPRSEDEIITMLTPERHLRKIFQGLDGEVIVCGHTHHQFEIRFGEYRVANAGSIGLPYDGRPGAYWAILGPEIELRRTEYDVERAVEEALAAGYPDPNYRETLLNPPQPEAVAAFFENVAIERGERGGEDPSHADRA